MDQRQYDVNDTRTVTVTNISVMYSKNISLQCTCNMGQKEVAETEK